MDNKNKEKNENFKEKEKNKKQEKINIEMIDKDQKDLEPKELISIINKMKNNIKELSEENFELKKYLKEMKQEIKTLKSSYPNKLEKINEQVIRPRRRTTSSKSSFRANVRSVNLSQKREKIIKTPGNLEQKRNMGSKKTLNLPFKKLYDTNNYREKLKKENTNKKGLITKINKEENKFLPSQPLRIKKKIFGTISKIERRNGMEGLDHKKDESIKRQYSTKLKGLRNYKEKYHKPLHYHLIEKIDKIHCSYNVSKHTKKKSGNSDGNNNNPFKVESDKNLIPKPKIKKRIKKVEKGKVQEGSSGK